MQIWGLSVNGGRRLAPVAVAVVLVLLSAILLVMQPAQPTSAQVYDGPPTITVAIETGSQYVFRDDQGYAVLTGMIGNTNQLGAVSELRIRVNFYDDIQSAPLDVVYGDVLAESIPPESSAPFLIRSSEPDTRITQASARIMSFDNAPIKSSELSIEVNGLSSTTVDDDTNLVWISGTLQNGPAPSSNVTLHLAFYDAFEPPRILDVRTVHVGDIAQDSEAAFEFKDEIDAKARGVMLFAESNVFSAPMVNEKLPSPIRLEPLQHLTMLSRIMDVTVTSQYDDRLSTLTPGEVVKITGTVTVEFADGREEHETPYTFLAQVRGSSEATPVEFIGQYEGMFVDDDDAQRKTINWTPEKSGLYIVETFMWNKNNVPLSQPGPVVLVLVE